MSEAVRRYGAALDAAVGHLPEKEVETLCDAAERFADTIVAHDDLRRFLLSPAFTAAEKRETFSLIADRLALAGPLRNLFATLIEERRTDLLAAIAREARRTHRVRSGIAEIEVRTADPLDDRELAGLRPDLERLFGTRLVIRRVTDPSLIGGIVVRHGNTVYDASVRNHLRILADALKEGERRHA